MTTDSTEAIVVLKDVHQQIRALFRESQKSGTTDARKGRLAVLIESRKNAPQEPAQPAALKKTIDAVLS